MSTQSSATSSDALIPEARVRLGNDPIFSLHADAVRRQAAGESILNATLGAVMTDDGRLATMPVAFEAVAAVPDEVAAAYAPISGTPAFLRAVVSDVLGEGPLSAQAVAVATAGATGAIHHAMHAFVGAGQAALAPSYYWGPYQVIAEHAGRALDVFSMFDANIRFDVAAFEAALSEQLGRQGRALALFNFPCNNPTGYSLDAEEWEAVAEVVREAGTRGPVAFFIDYAYARFASEANAWIDHLPTMLESATVLVGWTASKTFAQYGARVGALVALHRDAGERARIADALGYSCRATWSNCNHRGLQAVTALLEDDDLRRRAHRERGDLIELLEARATKFNRLAAEAGLAVPRYSGGFFVSVFTPDAEVTAAVMREAGVYVVPLDGAVRVALCATPEAAVPRLVDALAAGVGAAGRASPS